MTLRRIYLAHQLSAPTREGIEANRRAAARWAAWISTTFKVAVSADWIWMTGELTETEANRAHGLACDLTHIERCDELWAVGPRFSSGMTLERQHAVSCGLPTYDLTGIALGMVCGGPAKRTRAKIADGNEAVILAALTEQGWKP